MKKLFAGIVCIVLAVSVYATPCGQTTHSCRDEFNGAYSCCPNSTKNSNYHKRYNESVKKNHKKIHAS